MSWLSEWQALSSRINGIVDAANFFFNSQRNSSSDERGVRKKVLLKTAMDIENDLARFTEGFCSVIPVQACECIERFLQMVKGLGQYDQTGEGFLPSDVQLLITGLAAFRSEFAYIISDNEAISKRITERAFIHLQRSIVADSSIRQKWQDAFKKREERCEQLGAVHLLSHGIWAFKVDAATGGKTDLIMNEPLSNFGQIESTADALVLTEWKLVRTKSELASKIDSAKKQASIYSSGILGGIELAHYRYLVMVSEQGMIMPGDETVDAIKYRHVNIAVDPSSPSAEARTTS